MAGILRTILPVLLAITALVGCADLRSKPATAEIRDIHERLSQAIRKHGFSHGIRSQRGNQDIDSIYVSVPLDALIRRHASLESLLRDIAVICASTDYVTLIELGAQNEKDMAYMKGQLEPGLGGKKNVTLEISPSSRSDITITVMHPNQAARK